MFCLLCMLFDEIHILISVWNLNLWQACLLCLSFLIWKGYYWISANDTERKLTTGTIAEEMLKYLVKEVTNISMFWKSFMPVWRNKFDRRKSTFYMSLILF